MNFQINEQAALALNKQKKHRLYVLIVVAAAIITVIGVVIALTRPGRAFSSLEKKLDCQVSVHQHNETCYDVDGNLVCGMADYVAHVHNQDDCYDENGNLVCTLSEIIPHEHTDECYIERLVLTCGYEEGDMEESAEGAMTEETVEVINTTVHNHSEACFTQTTELTCAAQEHTHSDSCRDAEGNLVCGLEEHTHSDACYTTNSVATCGYEEGQEIQTISYETKSVPTANEAKPHVHDESCYTIEKELICEQQTLHVHDAQCYENGVLTCGQLQLAQHVHGKECYVYEEKSTTVVAYAGGYKITATYGPSAKIPENAEFKASIITPETDSQLYEESEEAAKQAVGNEDASSQAMFDIGFYVDGVEIEPQGNVEVTFTLADEYDEGDEISIIHIENDGNVDVNNTVVNGAGEAVINTDSFSIYVLLNNGTKPTFQAGKYGNYTIAINDTKDGFRTLPKYAAYRMDNSPLGLAGSFHIVAFSSVTVSSHVNGNFCTPELITGNNFGTNNLANELSYVGKYTRPSGNSGTTFPGCMLAIGSDNEIKISGNNGGDTIYFVNGSAETKLDSPYLLTVDKSADTPLIDFDVLKAEIISISNSLAGQGNINAVTSFTSEDNGSYIKLTDPDVAGYVNLTADQINAISNVNLKMDGFSAGKNGTLIVNVDCNNMKANAEGKKVLNLPKTACIYVDGKEQSTGEVTTFENGKVIWNIINSNNVEIHTYRMTGIVIAPYAYVVAEGNLNGQIIADKAKINGETHRTNFTGTTIPFSAGFTFNKTVDGQTPNGEQVFKFNLSEYKNGQWNVLQTKTNSGTNIAFDNITYTTGNQAGTYWYLISEVDKSGDKDSVKYGYDTKCYVYKVVVTYNVATQKLDANTTKYSVDKLEDIKYVDGAIVESSLKSYETGDTPIFNNTSKLTDISVEKKWEDYDGTVLAQTKMPEKLTVKLYQTIDENLSTKDETLTGLTPYDTQELNAANNWKYEWLNLPSEDGNGNKYYYYVAETQVDGFKFLGASVNNFIEKGIIVLTNQYEYVPEKTTITVEKVFKLIDGTEIKNPGIVKDNEYIEFKLLQFNSTIVDDKGTPYAGKVKVDGTEVESTDGIFKIALEKDKTEWQTTLTDLPLTEYVDGQLIEYSYEVVETKCSLADYIQNGDAEVKVTYYDADGNVLAEDADKSAVNSKKYEFTLVNSPKLTELEVEKIWVTSKGVIADSIQYNPQSDKTVEIKLFRVCGDTYEAVGAYIIGATSASKKDDSAKYDIVSTSDANTNKYFAAKFTNLQKYYVDKAGELQTYTYRVEESELEEFELVMVAGEDDAYKTVLESSVVDGKYSVITLVNQSDVKFVLPETGSTGLRAIYILGSVMVLGALGLFLYRRKIRK